MNKHVHIVLLLMIALMAPGILMSQDAGVVYLEGWPSLRSGGSSRELDFGLAVRPGDSVLTGRRDYVELDQGGNTIRINADTVFTLREIEREGRRETVMTNTVGSVAYRFQTLAGRRQQVGTTTAVAGVRGTEFTVYAGSDGSSLFAVDEGLVAVESAGVEVEVARGQAVEVRAGEAPGEVYSWIGSRLDFSEWDHAQFQRFLDNPVDSVARIQARVQEFAAAMQVHLDLLAEIREDITRYRELISAAVEDEEKDRIRQEQLFPAMNQAGVQVLNYRYYSLSALSLRRFVAGRMYMEMKTRYILDPMNPVFRDYEAAHRELLSYFEETMTAQLVEADI